MENHFVEYHLTVINTAQSMRDPALRAYHLSQWTDYSPQQAVEVLTGDILQ